MNEKQKRINEAVDQTLNSLDGLKPVEASPFMFTRIMQAVDAPQTPAPLLGIGSFKLAMLALLLLINVFTIVNALNGVQNDNRAAQLNVLAEEYRINVKAPAQELLLFQDQ